MNQSDYFISTPENVDLHIELAGIGNRGLACLIDTFISSLMNIFVIVIALLSIAFLESQNSFPRDIKSVVEIAAVSIAILASFLITAGYYIYFEGRWHGQTPGKKFAGIRVIDANGQPATWSSIFIRNLIRNVDMILFIGLLPMLVDKLERRIGDFSGGTIVIRERNLTDNQTHLIDHANNNQNLFNAGFDIGQVSPDDYQLLTEFLKRRVLMTKNNRLVLANKMLSYFEKKLSTNFDKINPEQKLEDIYSAYLIQAGQ
jgi:uncharacterized RDD family membrane protein YckC